MAFFDFNQNNSGGSWDFDAAAGISHWVIVEALTADQASARAQDIGLYFDGVSQGMDCGCCGDRWYEPSGEGDEAPTIYAKTVAPHDPWKPEHDWQIKWMRGKPEGYIHYLDGRIEPFWDEP